MMGYITANTKEELDIINTKINNHMKTTIPNYSGDRWGVIKKIGVNWILEINDDSRLPLSQLTNSQKARIDSKVPDKWSEVFPI